MKEKITEIDYYECLRCNINKSDNPTGMCPCPRGGCEAVLKGKIVTTEKLILNSEPQAPEGAVRAKDMVQDFINKGKNTCVSYGGAISGDINANDIVKLMHEYSSLQNKVAQDRIKELEASLAFEKNVSNLQTDIAIEAQEKASDLQILLDAAKDGIKWRDSRIAELEEALKKLKALILD